MVQSVLLAESTGPGAPKSFAGKLAVVTGGGSGMGRELARQLAAAGCSLAVCDWRAEAVAETAAMARAGAPPGALVTSHACDVSDEVQTRDVLIRLGLPTEGASVDELRQMAVRLDTDFRDKAPLSAAQAATIILDGVRADAWRILVGEDAK